MVKYKEYIFLLLIFFFLFFSFSPTIFELSKSTQLKDPIREFILEHNYYWPDFNLYLSKIRQGYEGRLTALERYTSEPHQGSLLQEFYVVLGLTGKVVNIDPNFSYQLGRVILSPLLLFIIMMFSVAYFRSFRWQILAFSIVVVSGSFPRFYTDGQGILHIGRFMEWWSNIDALQRITFIPHILFGQVISFYLLYKLTINPSASLRESNQQLTITKLLIYILLGNLVGLVFPPSLITLNGVIFLTMMISLVKKYNESPRNKLRGINCHSERNEVESRNLPTNESGRSLHALPLGRDDTLTQQAARNYCFGVSLKFIKFKKFEIRKFDIDLSFEICHLSFLIFTLPSLLYLFFITKTLPWSALVDFHRTHPMMIPFGEYIQGTGPIFYLGLAGAVLSIVNRNRKFRPLILWLIVTFFFAILFTHIKEQSPLRFTQTGLFIPLGILGTYFLWEVWKLLTKLRFQVKHFFVICYLLFVICYLSGSLYMMKISLDWQTTWISQRIGANIPLVPYPPQTMYPLKGWMDGIRWLRDNANHDNDVVLAEITAGNYIPAYGGNTVYFGQANTVDYERKQQLVDRFYKGEMNLSEAKNFLIHGRVKYIFVSVAEKEMATGKDISKIYNFLLPVFKNSIVNIYTYQ